MKVTREQIIKKSVEYFASHDYERSSLNSIAQAIDITKGGIYHYFESKEELFLTCIHYVVDMIQDFTEGLISADAGLEEIIDFIYACEDIFQTMKAKIGVSTVGSYLEYFYLVFAGIKKFPELKERMTALYRQMQQGLEAVLRASAQAGLLKEGVDPSVESFAMVAQSEGAMMMISIDDTIDGKSLGAALAEQAKARLLR
jgi:AcrR family transcriptional regulator